MTGAAKVRKISQQIQFGRLLANMDLWDEREVSEVYRQRIVLVDGVCRSKDYLSGPEGLRTAAQNAVADCKVSLPVRCLAETETNAVDVQAFRMGGGVLLPSRRTITRNTSSRPSVLMTNRSPVLRLRESCG